MNVMSQILTQHSFRTSVNFQYIYHRNLTIFVEDTVAWKYLKKEKLKERYHKEEFCTSLSSTIPSISSCYCSLIKRLSFSENKQRSIPTLQSLQLGFLGEGAILRFQYSSRINANNP